MDFDNRDADWKSFLQIKSNLVSAFKEHRACKICMCLELLKVATCPNSCGDWDEIFENLLVGILDTSTIQTIRGHMSDHADNIQLGSSVQSDLKALQSTLQSYNDELRKFSDVEKQVEFLSNTENQPPVDGEILKRVDFLENRICTYEESLTLLRKENDDLRLQLGRARLLYEEYNKVAKSAHDKFSSQINQVKDEQHRFKGSLETIAKQVSDNAATIETMKKELIEGGRTEMESAIREIRKEKNDWIKEQENTNRRVSAEVEKLSKGQTETENRIADSLNVVNRLKEEFAQLQRWQNECRDISRHSGHLLSAADSVFSTHQQYLESQQIISEYLEGLKKELEFFNKQ